MIKICTWLLGFSSSAIGWLASGKYRDFDSGLAIFGVLISLLSAFVALLYGSYAAKNWAFAEQIEKEHRAILSPKEKPLLSPIVQTFAPPCGGRIAPIFWIYWGLAVGLLGVHLCFLRSVWSR
jgi:hypothetical protein